MLDPACLADLIFRIVELSDAIYAAHHGTPGDDSVATREVEEFDDALAEETATPGPLFGAYAVAEGKLRTLNDLSRSAAILLPARGTSVGYVNVMRAAVETAARLHWTLASSGDHRDRAARLMRERLRTVSEISKFDDEAREAMKEYESEIRGGAARAGLDVPGPPPPAIDLIVELLSSDGVLVLDGLSRAEIAAMFYRLPSAPTHAAMHGIAVHHEDPSINPDERMTQPPPWEQTLLLTSGWFSGYATAHRGLLALYGWDCRAWDAAATDLAQKLVEALAVERSSGRTFTDSGDDG